MLKLEQKNNFIGFGNGEKSNQLYWAQNVIPSNNGVSNELSFYLTQNGSTTLNAAITSPLKYLKLGKAYWNGSWQTNPYDAIIGMDDNGYIFVSDYNAGNGAYSGWELAHRSTQAMNIYNGMYIDQKGRIIYAGERYIGYYDPSANDYTVGTVTVSNGSANIVGSGTTFTAGMVGKRFRVASDAVFYTVSTFTDATHIALTGTYNGTSGGSKTYRINTQWNDSKWDLGASYYGRMPSYNKPIGTYEDYILVGYNNKIAVISSIDDSISLSGFTMPTDYYATNISSNKGGVLMSFYYSGGTVLVLWDAQSSRSIAPWIQLPGQTYCYIKPYKENWIVFTDKSIYITNGYTLQVLRRNYPDASFESGSFMSLNCVVGDMCYGYSTYDSYGRSRLGISAYDIANDVFYQYKSPDNNQSAFNAIGALENIGNEILFSFQKYSSSISYIYRFRNLYNSTSQITTSYYGITNPNKKTAEAVRIHLASPNSSASYSGKMKFKLTARIYNGRNTIVRTKSISATQVSGTSININNVSNPVDDVAVGYDVTFLNGNNAGDIRTITEVLGIGTSALTLILDANTTASASSGDVVLITPFKKIGSVDYTATGVDEFPEIYLPVNQKTKGSRFMVRLDIEQANFPIEITGVELLYNDLGIV